jgi:hypothetical protein
MKVPVLIAVSVAIVLMSCGKDPTDSNTNGLNSIPKIKTRATSTETTTFTYDGNGKVH